jgi:hypothetical protein
MASAKASAGYHRSMEHGAVIRGRLHGRVIELDDPVDDVEEGEVEVQIRSVQSATPRPPDLLEVGSHPCPPGTEPRLTSISSWPMSGPAGPAVADVYLDACCFIYLVEGQPAWRSAVDARLRERLRLAHPSLLVTRVGTILLKGRNDPWPVGVQPLQRNRWSSSPKRFIGS